MYISFKKFISERLPLKDLSTSFENELAQSTNLICKTIASKKSIYVCGNGGSAAQSDHFVCELMVKFKKFREPLSAISLNTNNSLLTAHINDLNIDEIFSRQLLAHSKKNDLLILFSTSGSSKNIVKTAKVAKKNNLKVISIIGNNDKFLKKYSDIIIKSPSDVTDEIQEHHLLFIHYLCFNIDEKFK